ncbi:MAG: ribose-phosphate pyrophosphokinase, partial [Planctomycetota bacterium]|nr:ribose-phosphate pyrophosphokinase [Planctomycetota bacterium]
MSELLLFALGTTRPLGEGVSRALGAPLAAHEEREFEWGQHKARPLVNVRGRDVYVLHSLHGEPGQSANDKLCRLLFFLGALRDASAGRVTAVVPFLCYSRKDRKTKPRDPVTTRYVAALFEAVGADRVLTVDVHNLAAYQNAFRCRAEHLEGRPLLVERLAAGLREQEAVVVVSPDAGGVHRADALRASLARALGRPVDLAFVEKRRSEGVVSGDLLAGD